MSSPGDTSPGAPGSGQAVYRLRVEGVLDELAFDYVANLTLAPTAVPAARAVPTLTHALPDQAALVGLVNLLHDFGLPLIQVERLP